MQRPISQLFILLSLFVSTLHFAQNNNLEGLYITAADFRANNITFTKITGKKFRFRPDNLFNASILKITIGDSVYKIKKTAIFGYKSNKYYRIYNEKEYEIMNPNEQILLYSKTFLTGYKSNQITKYFFSISSESGIYELTIHNLKCVTNGDTLFHNQLDMFFNYDEDLLKYDSFYNSYKINRVCQTKKNEVKQ